MSLHWVIFMVVPNSNRVRGPGCAVACWLERWLVGLALVCVFVCAFVSAFVCSFRFVVCSRVSCSGLRFVARYGGGNLRRTLITPRPL